MTTISCCMITAGEKTLEAAVESIRPHVDELVAVVTRDASLEDLSRYEKLFDRCVVLSTFFPRGDDGAVDWSRADFAAARNASFALATSEWVMWADSDDVLVGGENLRPTVARFTDPEARVRLLAKYEYALDEEGRPLIEQWRERIVRRAHPYSWKNPVHEFLTADDGVNGDVKLETVTWRHQREINQARSERNLQILEAHAARLGDAAERDAWLQLNLGLEKRRSQRHEEALTHFARYVAASSRTDEQALACLEAAESALALGPLNPQHQEAAIVWCERGQGFRRCFETLFAEATVQFVRGATGDRDALEMSRKLVLAALAEPPTVTPLAVKPQDRSHNAPELLRVIYETLEDWGGAVEACDLLLRAQGGNALIAMQRRRYERLDGRALVTGGGKAALDIVIACGPTIEEWNPKTAAERGIGGSETAVIEVSRRLAAVGHQVRVYTDCGAPAVHDGVWWLPTALISEAGAPDVAVVWRNAQMLDFFRGAKARVVWAHDTQVHHLTDERAMIADRVLGLSAWHVEELRKRHGLHPAQTFQTRNGIDLTRFDAEPERDGTRSSTPRAGTGGSPCSSTCGRRS